MGVTGRYRPGWESCCPVRQVRTLCGQRVGRGANHLQWQVVKRSQAGLSRTH